MMKIVHEKYKSTKKLVDPVISEFQASFGAALEYNKELDTLLSRAQVTQTTHCLLGSICYVMFVVKLYCSEKYLCPSNYVLLF